MRSSASKNAPAPRPAPGRRRKEDDDAPTPVARHASAEAVDTPVDAEDVVAPADADHGRWTVASAGYATGSQAATSGPGAGGSAADGEARPPLPSLVEAGIGLGVVGLLGAIAVGASTKASAVPSPVTPIKPVNPVRPVDPVRPIDPFNPVTPVDPVDPVNPVKPVDPVNPVNPVKPVKPVDPVDPVKPVDPVAPAQSTFSISNAHVIEAHEGTRELVFLVQRSGDISQRGSVRYSAQSGQSTTSRDELVGDQTGTVSFKPGESQQVIRLTLKGDYLRETDERVSVKLHDPVAGTLGRAEGDGTIHEVDVTRLQAAYGLRDLNPELDGPAICVRRSSDSMELDIGFDAHGQLDRRKLLDFVGSDSGAKGYVTRWYDQSGNSRDMTASVPALQGVIVDGGKIVTRADTSAAISFNAGRNGENFDTMTATGLAADDWRSAVIYANVQSEGTQNGTLFNLGEAKIGRLSVHFPAQDKVSFDVRSSESHRLDWNPGAPEALLDSANDMVFEIHSGNRTAGNEALNYTDASEAIFQNGHRVASHGKESTPGEFATTSRWRLASHDDSGDRTYYQQAMYNEFLVYLAKDNSTPSLQNLIGTAQDDVLSYAGEQDLKRIDGLAGHDTLYVAGTATLDLTRFSAGIKNVEQFWLDNGEANTLQLTARTLSNLAVKTLEIRLDANDRVEIDEVRVPVDGTLMNRLQMLSPTMQFKIIVDGQPVMG